MLNKLSNIDIGQRITSLRKAKGYSQEELAKLIGITRSSLSRIEHGITSLDVLDLQELSHALAFSLDDFLSAEFNIFKEPVVEYSKVEKEKIRISVPEFNQIKFMNVLLYILQHCAGRPNIGDTMLNKLLYFCDFNYYEQYEELLTGSKYRKLTSGPVTPEIDNIIADLINRKELIRIKSEYQGLPQTRYLPLIKADLTLLSAAEKEIIDNVILVMGDWNINTITKYIQNDMPLVATEDGDYISYNLAFYREVPYSVRVYEEQKVM